MLKDQFGVPEKPLHLHTKFEVSTIMEAQLIGRPIAQLKRETPIIFSVPNNYLATD